MEILEISKRFNEYIYNRALGVAKPAFDIVNEGFDKSGKVFQCYKDCIHQAMKIVNAVGQRNLIFNIENMCAVDFAELVEECYRVLWEYLHEKSEKLLMRDREETVLAWCGDFRYCFSKLERKVKKNCLKQLPCYRKKLDFSQGVLVRSVNSLRSTQGFWGANFPTVSTSFFKESEANWYLKGHRNRMLIYSIESAEDVVAMFPTDSNSLYCTKLKRNSDTRIERLLIEDLEKDAEFSLLYSGYQCAYTLEQLTSGTELCEIVLRNSVKPKGVLIGDVNQYRQDKKMQFETEIFAIYYQLPIYAWKDGKVSLLPYSLQNIRKEGKL